MPNPLIRTTLDLHPELAQKVGLVVAEYALLERSMWTVYALLPGFDPKASLLAFYSLRSIRRRQSLVLQEGKAALNEAHQMPSKDYGGAFLLPPTDAQKSHIVSILQMTRASFACNLPTIELNISRLMQCFLSAPSDNIIRSAQTF
jgi:hypothetical protein